MAIQNNLDSSEFGISFQNVYYRISLAGVSRTLSEERVMYHQAMIDLVGYATKPTSIDTKAVDFRRYHVPYAELEAQTGDTFLAKCYAWLMNHPDMQGCVGV